MPSLDDDPPHLELARDELPRSGDSALRCMLEARSVALVGVSRRPGSLGERALVELDRSPGKPQLHLVNPRYAGESIGSHPVVGSLDDLSEPLDLVVLAVGDANLEQQLAKAAVRGDRSAVVFASAFDPATAGASRHLRQRLAEIATDAGMALCGGGCMGFVSREVRAIGFLEPYPLPEGPIAFITHSGSAFSALLRAERPFGWSLAVSSGQELVTTTAEYLEYALDLPDTGVVALVLETLRAPDRLRRSLARAESSGIPVVLLAVGASEAGQAMVEAHSGALAGSDGAWEALCDAYGVLRVHDLQELCDTLELLVSDRRPRPRPAGALASGRGDAQRTGIAAVLDSGAERALLVDTAAALGVPFASIGPTTRQRLAELLDPGLEVGNPLDVWGSGHETEDLFAGALLALASDEAVDAVALAIDLVPEYDGNDAYRDAVVAAWHASSIPMCVLSHVPSAIDRAAARRLRTVGIPILEGTRPGLLALRHLLEWRDRAERARVEVPSTDPMRRARWLSRLATRPLDALDGFSLLADYGIASPDAACVSSVDDALEAAGRIGYPVVLKTATRAHKSDVAGVVLDLRSPRELAAAYSDLERRLGPDATVTAMAPSGVELALGIVRDPLLGPLVVVGAGGTLVELTRDRAVALPPLDHTSAARLVDKLRVRPLLDGYRGRAAVDMGAVLDAVVAVSSIAVELGGAIAALDVNPLTCAPQGALALDVLVETEPTHRSGLAAVRSPAID
ncbi:MAG: acetate--CoA ligase family protein [Acidimicrobiales bacterium]